MPRTASGAVQINSLRCFTETLPLLKSHSCQQQHGWQVQAESRLEIWMGLLGGFLSSLLLCFQSTGYPDLCSMGNVSSLLRMAQLQIAWLLSCSSQAGG